MKPKNAIRVYLTLTGRYNIPGEFLTIKGFDAYGGRVTETIPAVDWPRLERDVAILLAQSKT